MTGFVHPTIGASGSGASAARAVRPLIVSFLLLAGALSRFLTLLLLLHSSYAIHSRFGLFDLQCTTTYGEHQVLCQVEEARCGRGAVVALEDAS
jgi:hypothetical protein